MIMKKTNILVFLMSLILVVNFVPFANAGLASDVNDLIDGVVDVFTPITERVLGTTPGAEWLFAKFLFLLIIFSVVWAALTQIDFFKENDWVLWIVSIAVSVLSTRFIASEKLIQTILLPYTTMGVVITAGLPFIIFSLVVTVGLKKSSQVVRRLAWVFFAVVFIGLWLSRIEEMGTSGYVYLVFAIASFIMIKMDGTFQRWQRVMEVEKELNVIDFETYTRLLKRRDELQDAMLIAKKTGADSRKIAALGGKLGGLNAQLAKLYGGSVGKK